MAILKSLHVGLGLAGILIFVLTGQYMEIFLHGLNDMPEGPRLLYRTSHLYLMWSSLLNLIVGFYFTVAATRDARIAQVISSALLLAGPPLILAGFFIESPENNISRPLCGVANYFALAGVIVHVFANRKPITKSADI